MLEPNIALRRAIRDLLLAENFLVTECESLEQVLQHASSEPHVALVAWQSMEGLLADEHRHRLVQMTERVRLVVMVPRRWVRLLDQTDLGFVGMVAKPFDADELLSIIRGALAAAPVALAR